MNKKRKNLYMLILGLFLFFILNACGNKSIETNSNATIAKEKAKVEMQQKAIEEELKKAIEIEAIALAKKAFTNQRVFFKYNSSILEANTQKTLTIKAKWMKNNPEIKVIIEGHCDERGTAAYNIALGNKRAEVSKKFIVNSGIDEDRIEIISYGEEKPFVSGKNETSWAQNRCANFVIK